MAEGSKAPHGWPGAHLAQVAQAARARRSSTSRFDGVIPFRRSSRLTGTLAMLVAPSQSAQRDRYGIAPNPMARGVGACAIAFAQRSALGRSRLDSGGGTTAVGSRKYGGSADVRVVLRAYGRLASQTWGPAARASGAEGPPGEGIAMDLYVIVRRNGWASPEDLQTAAERSVAEGDKPGSGVRWIRSYVLGAAARASRPPNGGARPTGLAHLHLSRRTADASASLFLPARTRHTPAPTEAVCSRSA